MYVGTLSAVVLGGASTIGGVALGYENGISEVVPAMALEHGLDAGALKVVMGG